MGRQRARTTKIIFAIESWRIQPIVGAQFSIVEPCDAIVGPKLTLGRAVVRSVVHAQLAVVFPLQLESIEPQPEPVLRPSTLDYTTGSIARDATEPVDSLGVQ